MGYRRRMGTNPGSNHVFPPPREAARPGGGWVWTGIGLGIISLGGWPVLHILVVPFAVFGAVASLIAVGVLRENGLRSLPGWVGMALNAAAIAVSMVFWSRFGAPFSGG